MGSRVKKKPRTVNRNMRPERIEAIVMHALRYMAALEYVMQYTPNGGAELTIWVKFRNPMRVVIVFSPGYKRATVSFTRRDGVQIVDEFTTSAALCANITAIVMFYCLR